MPEKIDVHWSAVAMSIEDVSAILKEKFPNLAVQDVVRLSNNIVRAVIRRVEEKTT